jgi:hypothetical protein
MSEAAFEMQGHLKIKKYHEAFKSSKLNSGKLSASNFDSSVFLCSAAVP